MSKCGFALILLMALLFRFSSAVPSVRCSYENVLEIQEIDCSDRVVLQYTCRRLPEGYQTCDGRFFFDLTQQVKKDENIKKLYSWVCSDSRFSR